MGSERSMNKNTIKALVFDVGGVLYINNGGNVSQNIAEELGISFEDLRQEYYKYNHLANVHNIPWEDVVIKAVRVFNTDSAVEKRARQLIRDHNSKNILNVELIALFPLLKEKGLKLSILSNAGKHLRGTLERDGIASLMDKIIISGEVGHQKPHKEIFDALFNQLDLEPGEVALIDDSRRSLEKADEIGYIPVLFTDNEQLTLDLKRLGFDLS